MDFCSRVFLVFPAISLRRSHDADFRRMEIGPAGARLATKRAVALVDEVRSFWDFDADLAAEAGERQHSQCHISRAARPVEAVRCPHSSVFSSAAPGYQAFSLVKSRHDLLAQQLQCGGHLRMRDLAAA